MPIKIDLTDYLKATHRLRLAISETIASWPLVRRCWIDEINEPTRILQEHRLDNQ
jgi:hypothetical protein